MHGYREERATTTPFDTTVRNELDRFHLGEAAVSRTPGFADHTEFKDLIAQKLAEHWRYIRDQGEDMPEIFNWRWAA